MAATPLSLGPIVGTAYQVRRPALRAVSCTAAPHPTFPLPRSQTCGPLNTPVAGGDQMGPVRSSGGQLTPGTGRPWSAFF